MRKQFEPLDEAARRIGTSLAILYKALKAVNFYPAGHPQLAENLRHSHNSLVSLLQSRELLLAVGRNGFSGTSEGGDVDNNPMALALARELYSRRVQRLAILPDLLVADLRSFLMILGVDPQKLVAAGGIEEVMAKNGIKTIWVNEVDIRIIESKREEMEKAEAELESRRLDGNPETHMDLEDAISEQPQLSPAELLMKMSVEMDDRRYLDLSRQLTDRCDELKDLEEFDPLVAVLSGLLEQIRDSGKSVAQREYARFSLNQVAGGGMTDFMVRQVEEREQYREQLYPIMAFLGEQISYPLLARLADAEDLNARKALAVALVRIGEGAVTPLLSLLHDARWYFVRNIVAVLGEIRSPRSVEPLKRAAFHADDRVRKETIRSLSKIGGRDAESVIISLLMDSDPGIRQQAALSLGIMKSRLAIRPLIEVLTERDFFLTSLQVKREAVQAIGRIGDRESTQFLLEVLQARYVMAWQKRDDLKIAVVSALGQLRDERALPALRELADKGGNLGRVCQEAIEAIERVAEEA